MPLGLFILGASSTKDFSDIPGDRAGGCNTLPVQYGIRKTAKIIAPFFVLPFFLWPWMSRYGWLSGWAPGLYLLAAAMAGLGAYIDFVILRRPEELSRSENHISWKLIYIMAILAYGGLALIYIL